MPRPAMVWMGVPGAAGPVSWRMRPLRLSATVSRASGERMAERGVSREAEVAGPLSPENCSIPEPATVVMMPVAASMRRMR